LNRRYGGQAFVMRTNQLLESCYAQLGSVFELEDLSMDVATLNNVIFLLYAREFAENQRPSS
jgi:hypothetical protein